MLGPVRTVHLKERTVCAVRHDGPVERVDETRRPLYRHMIIHELVGGPSILRFPDGPSAATVDALVVTHTGYEGDEVCRIEVLPAGDYAVADYEGPHDGLGAARSEFLLLVGKRTAGPVLQVHLMDEIDGVAEQQFQAFLGVLRPQTP